MKNSILVTIAFSLFSAQLIAQTTLTESGVSLDADWKLTVYEFAEENLQHSAWGLQHYERNYLLGQQLASSEGLSVDDDILFAAAFLHDMGVFEPYVIADAEHSQTATENIDDVLLPAGFPAAKIPEVKTAILAHMFYAIVPDSPEAQVLHDADTLDFLGVIGVTRILSLSTRHPWATDLSTAVATLENFSQQLPPSLVTESAKSIAETRVKEMQSFLTTLKTQSFDGASL